MQKKYGTLPKEFTHMLDRFDAQDFAKYEGGNF
jgi:hypothetical protein